MSSYAIGVVGPLSLVYNIECYCSALLLLFFVIATKAATSARFFLPRDYWDGIVGKEL